MRLTGHINASFLSDIDFVIGHTKTPSKQSETRSY